MGLGLALLGGCTRTVEQARPVAAPAGPPVANRLVHAVRAVRPQAGRTALEDRGGAVLAATSIEPGSNTIVTHGAQLGDLSFALDQKVAPGMVTSFSTNHFTLIVRTPRAIDVLDARQHPVGKLWLAGSMLRLRFPAIGLVARAPVKAGQGDAVTRGLLYTGAALVGSAAILGGNGVEPLRDARIVAAPIARWAGDAFNSVEGWKP